MRRPPFTSRKIPGTMFVFLVKEITLIIIIIKIIIITIYFYLLTQQLQEPITESRSKQEVLGRTKRLH
jgi:uncharacterized membrane protein YukC